MKGISFLSDLKIRGGYGVTGNQSALGSYSSLALYNRGSLYFSNGNWQPSYYYAQNPNPNLKWESTSSLGGGLDFSLFKSRVEGTIDIYDRRTSDLIFNYSVPVPPYLYSTMTANVGNISNKGIEFSVNADVIRNQDLRWTVTFNISHNKQLVTKLSNQVYHTDQIYTGGVNGRGMSGTATHILREGEEVSSFYGYKCLGLDPSGHYIIDDRDKNDTIDTRDWQVIGHALPKAEYGIGNTITYKGFDLSFFLRGIYGNDVFNNDALMMTVPSNFPNQVYKAATTTHLRDTEAYNRS